MKTDYFIKRVFWTVITILFLIGVFATTFQMTSFFYTKTGLNPSALAVQLINSFLGFLLILLIIFFLKYFFRARRAEMQNNIVTPIEDALERIARGDFNVILKNDLDIHFPEHETVTKLINSVNEMALDLSEVERLRQEFISNLSHEVQSPMTSIRGFARALQSADLDPEERMHYLNIIVSESIRVSRLSDNLLQLASLDSEDLKLEPKNYRLDKQIKNLILACEPQWMDKELDLDVSLEEATLFADEDLMSQVWTNLIHNSIKFTSNSGRINIGLQKVEEKIRFTIEDTGIGISEEDQPHVFERFFKADRSRQRSVGGSGLGLTITKKIIEMHDGEISLQSKLGIGSTFTVMLPIAK